LIVLGQDTSVSITKQDFSTILFAFSYIRSLENTSNLTSKQLTKQDSVIAYLQEVMTLERSKTLQKDSIIVNLESIVAKNEKARKREKVKNTLLQIGAGIVIGAEAGIITYLLIR